MKRIKKLNEFYNGLMERNQFIEIYINPTSSEISTIKSSDNNAIRGLIYDNGTEFCWIGNVLHIDIDKYCSTNSIPLDINTFRFSYENGAGWIFDAHRDKSFNELMQKIIQYKDKLSKYGDLNNLIVLYYASDDGNDYDKYNYEDINIYSNAMDFPNIASLEEFYTILKNNKQNENIG